MCGTEEFGDRDKVYRFQCEEQLSEHPATGREIKKLFLVEYYDEV